MGLRLFLAITGHCIEPRL